MIFNSRTYVVFTLVITFALVLTIHVISNRAQYTRIETFEGVIDCQNVELERKVKQRGAFLVFENFVMAENQFNCWDSITLTTPGDYRFLDNVVPLVERWMGPISVALYAPGTDFFTTIESIAYLRTCTTSLVRELVTFHLFFEFEHMPVKKGYSLINIYNDTFDCSLPPPYENTTDSEMYKAKHNLNFPINVARNIARTAAQTYFVFPSDIELYPTRNFISKFISFIKENPDYAQKDTKKVFVLPIFEVLAHLQIPENKTHLYSMFKEKKAFLFHQTVCSPCHKIPQQDEWLSAAESSDLGVFNVTKRQAKHNIWEPFFVSNQRVPLWDERLDWEGQGNKMSQAYALCVLDYDFAVLDNAFLVHKPGVKKKKSSSSEA